MCVYVMMLLVMTADKFNDYHFHSHRLAALLTECVISNHVSNAMVPHGVFLLTFMNKRCLQSSSRQSTNQTDV